MNGILKRPEIQRIFEIFVEIGRKRGGRGAPLPRLVSTVVVSWRPSGSSMIEITCQLLFTVTDVLPPNLLKTPQHPPTYWKIFQLFFTISFLIYWSSGRENTSPPVWNVGDFLNNTFTYFICVWRFKNIWIIFDLVS